METNNAHKSKYPKTKQPKRSIAVTVGKAKCVNKGGRRRLGPAFDYHHLFVYYHFDHSFDHYPRLDHYLGLEPKILRRVLRRL